VKESSVGLCLFAQKKLRVGASLTEGLLLMTHPSHTTLLGREAKKDNFPGVNLASSRSLLLLLLAEATVETLRRSASLLLFDTNIS
jgi:hypothetical protein